MKLHALLIVLIALIALVVPQAHATTLISDGMNDSSSGFHYQPNFDNGAFLWDSTVKRSGTGSLRIRFQQADGSTCDITGPGTAISAINSA